MERAASPRLAVVVLIGVATLAGAAVATGTVPVAGSNAHGTTASDDGPASADDPLSLATDEPDEDEDGETDHEDEQTDDEDGDENEWPWGDDDDENDDERDDDDEGDEDDSDHENEWPWQDDDNESDGGDGATTTQEPVSTLEPTTTATQTESQTATATATPSPTESPTVTTTPSPTAMATETPTPEPTPTETPEPTDTQATTPTATPDQQSSGDDTPTPTPTDTPVQQSSADETPTDTPEPTAAPTPQVGASTEQSADTSTPEVSFEIAETRVAGKTVSVGESAVVEARVRNPADGADRELVPLTVDGELVASKAVTLGAGESDVITFERTFDEVGDHEIVVGGTARSTVSVVESDTIEEPPTARNRTAVPAGGKLAPRSDDVEVVDADGLPDWVRSGYNASVETTLVNRANRTAVHTLSVAVDGQQVKNETVRVAPDTRRNVSVVFPAAAGEVTVDGATAGTLNVREDPAVGTDTGPERTSAGGDGFGAGAAVVGLACATLLVLMARSNRRSERSDGSR
ncbi:hypothetical protein [Halosimplex sp. J119]